MPEKTELPRRARKPRFLRRDATWVCVRYVRLGRDHVCEPGEPLPDNLRRHVVQSLWRRNLIGPEGDPWTEYQLASLRLREQKRLERAGARDVGTETVGADKGEASAADPEMVHVDHVGSGWYVIKRGGPDGEIVDRLRGTDAVNDWLRRHGSPPLDSGSHPQVGE